MKEFPVDIGSIKEYGVQRWLDEPLLWPVTNQEFNELQDRIEHHFLSVARAISPEISDAYEVLYYLVTEFTLIAHANIVTQRLHNLGFTVNSSVPDSYYDIFSQGKAEITLDSNRSLPEKFGYQDQARTRLRSWAHNIKNNGLHLQNYRAWFDSPACIALEWRDQRTHFKAYAESRERPLRILHWSHLWPQVAKKVESDTAVTASVQAFTDGFDTIVQDFGGQFSPAQLDSLGGILENSLLGVLGNTRAIQQNANIPPHSSLLLQGLGLLPLRCLAVVFRRLGHQVVGFPHGNNVGIYRTSLGAWTLMGVVDTFVAPTQGSVELFAVSEQEYLRPYGKQVNMAVSNAHVYEDLRASLRIDDPPTNIKHVMFMEYPLTPRWYEGEDVSFWIYHLDLTLRVARTLRQCQIQTTLKLHPDRLQESAELYDGDFDAMLSTRFEDVYDAADAYIFTTLRSSTFTFALLTNKPVIIFDFALDYIWEPAAMLLRKRCWVVPSWLDNDGRIIFDEHAFRAMLERRPEEPNDEFFEKYMYTIT